MSCPICYQTDFYTGMRCTDFSVSQETFTIIVCRSCGHKMTKPLPQDLALYYQSASYHPHDISKKGFIEKLYERIRRINLNFKFKQLKSQSTNPKLLDFGCGTGEFLEYCKTKNWIVKGYEPNTKARTITESKGIEMLTLDDLVKKTDKFDIITLWHVLEHVDDLNQIIKLLENCLSPNGRIYIAVPNHRSLDAKLYGNFWAAWDVPRHINHFSSQTLFKLFQKHGFSVCQSGVLLFDAFYISLLSEKYRKSGLLGNIRALIYGTISFIFGLLHKERPSSILYSFSKPLINDTKP